MSTNPTPGPHAAPTCLRGTILVVEDDEGVRRFVQLGLEHAGYAVLTAAHVGQALALYEVHADKIDLVLTDVIMPHRGGPELVAELRAIRPDVRVVFMSGYTGGLATPGPHLPPDTPLLEKPFSLDRLLEVVAAAIPGEPGA
jgi:DNA-binding NtrC family response regulator